VNNNKGSGEKNYVHTIKAKISDKVKTFIKRRKKRLSTAAICCLNIFYLISSISFELPIFVEQSSNEECSHQPPPNLEMIANI
jgi:hypothetical protein